MKTPITMNLQKHDKTVQEAFDEFIRYCKIKNLADSSIRFYEVNLKQFTNFYPATNLIKNINKKTIDDYILYLQENTNCNSVSVNTRLRAIRAFLNYCMQLGYLREFKIELIKAEKKIKETYSDEELKLLLAKPNLNNCRFTEYRNWVLVNWLLATGNRISTVSNIKIGDIDFNNLTITLRHTKNRKQQIIPLSAKLAEILQEYLMYRRGDKNDYLFCDQWGGQLTDNAIKIAISNYNKRRGVNKTSCHLFRHTFAKKWILNGGDIFRLQKILGHSSMDIVREYVNMFSDDLQQDYERFNPLDQLSRTKQPISMKRKGGR